MSNGRSSAVLEDFKSSKDSERRWTLAVSSAASDSHPKCLEACMVQGSACLAKSLSCSRCVQDVKGHILEFCKDQTGSRFIQQALDKDATPEQVPPRCSWRQF